MNSEEFIVTLKMLNIPYILNDYYGYFISTQNKFITITVDFQCNKNIKKLIRKMSISYKLDCTFVYIGQAQFKIRSTFLEEYHDKR